MAGKGNHIKQKMRSSETAFLSVVPGYAIVPNGTFSGAHQTGEEGKRGLGGLLPSKAFNRPLETGLAAHVI